VPRERHRTDERGALLPAGEARAEDRGLGVAGAVGDARERILTDELDALGRQPRHHARDELAERARLASLAGEQAGYGAVGH
jgi:hypothetical protein